MTRRSLKITFTASGWRIALLVLLLGGPWLVGVVGIVVVLIGLLRR